MPMPVVCGAGLLFETLARYRFPLRVLPDPFYIIPIWLNAVLTLPIFGIFWFFLGKLPYTVKGYYVSDRAATEDELLNVRLAPLTEWWPLVVSACVYVTAVVVTGACLQSRWMPKRENAAGRELQTIVSRRPPIHREPKPGDWIWEEYGHRGIGSHPPRNIPPKPPRGPSGRWVRKR
jgi:hypothetical protein